MKGYRPVIPTASLALTLVLLMIACSLTPTASEPQVRIIALGGSTVLPGDTLAIRPPVEMSAALPDDIMAIRAPADGSTVLLDDTIAIRASAGGKMALLDDISGLHASANASTVVIAIRVVAEDRRGIDSIQVKIDGQPVGGSIPPKPPVTHYTQDLCLILNAVGSDASLNSLYDITSGSHAITVVANHRADQAESEAITLYASYKSADASLWKAVTDVKPCKAGLFLFAKQSPICIFTPASPIPPTLTPVTPPPCYDGAAFIAHVAVPNGSQFDKGAPFSKVWRLRNTGTCTWDTSYQLAFVGGSQLSAPSAVAVPQVVPPSGIVDITAPMVAPDAIGTYHGQWQMRNPAGVRFGPVVDTLIEVRPGPDDPPIITRFEVVPNVISRGQSATISWEYVNGTFARLYPGGQAVCPTCSLVVSPSATTNYRLVVNNAVGTVERTITLTVQ